MPFEFWDIVIRPSFLIAFALVAAGFLPMLLSIKATWDAAAKKRREEMSD